MIIPTSKWDFIIRAVRISSYIPGRIRLHSKKLVGNAELGRKVYAYVASYEEIDKVDVNVLTGSVLITYRPQVLRTNRELARVENYIMTHAERRG
ncbi:MAG: HMA2 domain-containing protein [Megasphaera sp.]|uniref:HMA2 domain-containing protein n=1 Tax=Megasphaera sp. TaxID=2023260 RepID=UPI003F120286